MKKIRTSYFSITFRKICLIPSKQDLFRDQESLGIGKYILALALLTVGAGAEVSTDNTAPTEAQLELNTITSDVKEIDKQIKLLQEQKKEYIKKDNELAHLIKNEHQNKINAEKVEKINNIKTEIKEKEDIIAEIKESIKIKEGTYKSHKKETEEVILAETNEITKNKKLLTDLAGKTYPTQSSAHIKAQQSANTSAPTTLKRSFNSAAMPVPGVAATVPVPEAAVAIPIPADKPTAIGGGISGFGSLLGGFEKTVAGVVDQASDATDALTNTVKNATDTGAAA